MNESHPKLLVVLRLIHAQENLILEAHFTVSYTLQNQIEASLAQVLDSFDCEHGYKSLECTVKRHAWYSHFTYINTYCVKKYLHTHRLIDIYIIVCKAFVRRLQHACMYVCMYVCMYMYVCILSITIIYTEVPFTTGFVCVSLALITELSLP